MGDGGLLSCRDLTAVSRLVGRSPQFAESMRRLRATRAHEQFLLLSAPASLALGILTSKKDFLRRRLRVLIVGSPTLELLDGGQWFRFVPAMLGSAVEIEITATGVADGADRPSRAQSSLTPSQNIWAALRSESAAKVLKQRRGQFDVAISFSGFNWGKPLLEDLIELAEHGVPLYFTSFSSTHALLNHAILKAHGASADVVITRNPFALVSKRNGENWNRIISYVDPSNLPFPGTEIDEDYQAALQVTASMVLASHKNGDPSQIWPVGAPIEGGLIHTLDGISVHPQTCEVFDSSTEEPLGTLHSQWHEHVHAYAEGWDETDRLIWASHIRFFALSDGFKASVDRQGRLQ